MADKSDEREKRPDKDERPKSTAEKVAEIAADPVTGMLEGFAQAFREIVMDRSVAELVVLWLMGLVTTKIVVNGISNFIRNDANLVDMKHQHKMELLGRLTGNTEWFLKQCKKTLIECKDFVFDRASKYYQFLKTKDTESAAWITTHADRFAADAERIRLGRKQVSFLHPLSVFNRRLVWRRRLWPISIQTITVPTTAVNAQEVN